MCARAVYDAPFFQAGNNDWYVAGVTSYSLTISGYDCDYGQIFTSVYYFEDWIREAAARGKKKGYKKDD